MSRINSDLGSVRLRPTAAPGNTFVTPSVSRTVGGANRAADTAQALASFSNRFAQVTGNRQQAEAEAAARRAALDASRFENMKQLQSAVDAGEITESDNPWYIVQLRQEVGRKEVRSTARQIITEYETSDDPEVAAVRDSDNPDEVRRWAMSRFGSVLDGRNGFELEAMTPEVEGFLEQFTDQQLRERSKARQIERLTSAKTDLRGLADTHDANAMNEAQAEGRDYAPDLTAFQRSIDEKRLTLPASQLRRLVAESVVESASGAQDPERVRFLLERLTVDGQTVASDGDVRAFIDDSVKRIERERDSEIARARSFERAAAEDAERAIIEAFYASPTPIPATLENLQRLAPPGTPAAVYTTALLTIKGQQATLAGYARNERLEAEEGLVDFLTGGIASGFLTQDAALLMAASAGPDSVTRVRSAAEALQVQPPRSSDPETINALRLKTLRGTLTMDDVTGVMDLLSSEDRRAFALEAAAVSSGRQPALFNDAEINRAENLLRDSITLSITQRIEAADPRFKESEPDRFRFEVQTATEQPVNAALAAFQLKVFERRGELQSITNPTERNRVIEEIIASVSNEYGGFASVEEYNNTVKSRRQKAATASRAGPPAPEAAAADQSVAPPSPGATPTVPRPKFLTDPEILRNVSDPVIGSVAGSLQRLESAYEGTNMSPAMKERLRRGKLDALYSFTIVGSLESNPLRYFRDPKPLPDNLGGAESPRGPAFVVGRGLKIAQRLRDISMQRARQIAEIELPAALNSPQELSPIIEARPSMRLLGEYLAIRNLVGYTVEEVKGLGPDAWKQVRMFANVDDLKASGVAVSQALGLDEAQTKEFAAAQRQLLSIKYAE